MGASARKDKKKKKKTCRKARPDEFVTTSLPRLSPPFGEEVFFFFFSLGLLRVLRFTHVVLPCSVTLGSRWERERERRGYNGTRTLLPRGSTALGIRLFCACML